MGVLAWTGNLEFYRYLVKQAAEKNYVLTDTLFAAKDPDTGEIGPLISVKSEEEIFQMLDLEFVEPFYRNWKVTTHNTITTNATATTTIEEIID